MKKLLGFIFAAGVLAIIAFAGYTLFLAPGQGLGTLSFRMSYENAADRLEDLVRRVDWTQNHVQRRANLQLGGKKDLGQNLPEISQFPLPVNPARTGNVVTAEIFTSTEKSGTGIDGIMVEMAQAFNETNHQLSTGQTGKIIIRKIASGTGHEYLASGKYRADAFSPSNHLWVEMVRAHGVKMTRVAEQMVGNIAGVVMKEKVADRIRSEYGELNIRNIIDAVVQGKLVMGYTNPFASSTGVNFLVTVLATFAGGDPDQMLAPEVVSSFESFQRGVPFVALTTLQMRDSVINEGSLEAFVMEYQTYANTSVLGSGYEFIPFGIPHDNPLYAVGDLPREKMELLQAFAGFAEKPEYKKVAKEYGFNPDMDYQAPFEIPPGDVLVRAQKLWKEKKDAGRPISAVFLCDVSGSMRGARLNRLKRALLDGSEFISPNNAIGIVLFNHQVTEVLPVKKFDLIHKSAFHAAVEDMAAEGKTAMYDGVAVSLKNLVEEKEKNQNIKPLLFVLTDGETNIGMNFADISEVIGGLSIPIYTIGYEANIEELKRLSSLVEAASLNAGEGEIEYKIGALLNAQM